MNMMNMIKLKSKWDAFCRNHPKFPMFVEACNQNKLTEGTVIDLKVTKPDGTVLNTNVKLTAEDMELLKELKTMS